MGRIRTINNIRKMRNKIFHLPQELCIWIGIEKDFAKHITYGWKENQRAKPQPKEGNQHSAKEVLKNFKKEAEGRLRHMIDSCVLRKWKYAKFTSLHLNTNMYYIYTCNLLISSDHWVSTKIQMAKQRLRGVLVRMCGTRSANSAVSICRHAYIYLTPFKHLA